MKEIMNYLKESGAIEDLGFGNSIYWDKAQLSWFVTDGERRLAIDEDKAYDLIKELVTSF